jgi:uncharacterized protein YecE (DUF72 family)
VPSDDQLELLPTGPTRPTPPTRPPWIADLAARVAAWAARGVFFGTSSWKYAGWLGQLYTADRYRVRGRFAKARFERDCLAEYATVFPSVCGDFSFYQFPTPAFWQRLFAQVPASFQFGFKVPEQVTCPVFPQHERYGAQRGQRNDRFLDPDLLQREFLDRLRPWQAQVGYLVFEFPQLARATPATNATFLDQLDAFLGKLPPGFPYGVEIRTESLLGPAYLDTLRRHGVAHVFNSWTRMPPLGRQLAVGDPFTANHAVARLLLRPGRAYEQAVQAFQPYDKVQDPYPEGYRDAAALVRQAQADNPARKIFLAVNNRFVGNAPHAIAEIIRELDAGP